MRTEQLTKCFEPLQKMRVRFQGNTSVEVLIVLCFGVDLCTYSYFSSVRVTEWPPIGE